MSRANWERCPICGSDSPTTFLRRSSVPVHQNLLYDTPADARAAARGDLDLRLCDDCAFVFNAAFDPTLLTYGASYENSQDASPAFSAHVELLVERLASRAEVRTGHVVEVGCGRGAFLRRLLGHPDVDATAVGFDPAYVGPASELGGRLRFERSFYVPDTEIAADTVVCRHVIEHIADPVGLLRAIGSTATPERPVRLFVETPSVGWILRQRVPWDFFYEHCSLFDALSLASALERAAFGTVRVDRVFGDQYLWAEATTAVPEPATERVDGELGMLIASFDADAATELLGALVRQLAADGPTMVWGAGAKGATFCDLVDPSGSLLSGVVDLNEAKQGKYVAGTGHPIVSPDQAVAGGIMTAVVLNPNYTNEVELQLARLGSMSRTCDLTREMLACG